MEKLLIVNADDFGLCKGQNYGIIDSFRHGIVSSTTAMMNCTDIHHAAELSRQNPALPIGMHFVLTYGRPLTAMPSLVDANGLLSKVLWQRAEAGALNLTEIAQELAAQFDQFVAVFGRSPTHIDSHHHVHMLPQIYPLVEAFAREKSVALRIDRHEAQQHGITLNEPRSTDWFDAGFYGEDLSEQTFLQRLDLADQQGFRSLEVMCHPAFVDKTLMTSGYCYPRLNELDVLTSSALKQAIKQRGYRLGSYLDC
ncbi:chitin disaccharide deacetylase [Yersinia massiliensis]|uniref:Chitooligosaccharide deacetylase n=2 Tax=Yersinia TaxID=629 RepID=A0AAI8ZS21_YERFR|nr:MULTISPECIES: chitin disaccharide deacetylase [Yersinia]MDA5550140.1 chitin disaccharide deacetylase [Yersinia massiliensis]MDN0128885.1 chitin disaccharide deacetylase [Yersinia massiliensis]NIL28960.1 chitin disaccharide deacetylase [Yersinia massiliensis]UZM80112.1 chitin disaccharide deacetylase [Yersinia massiliensis]CFR04627.1 cellobiose phosphotransferase system YdjC-like protein [Yersinia frederiksenii]